MHLQATRFIAGRKRAARHHRRSAHLPFPLQTRAIIDLHRPPKQAVHRQRPLVNGKQTGIRHGGSGKAQPTRALLHHPPRTPQPPRPNRPPLTHTPFPPHCTVPPTHHATTTPPPLTRTPATPPPNASS